MPMGVPSAPTSLVATSSSGSIALSFNASSGLGTIKYNIYRSTTSGTYGSALATNVSSASYTDSTVTNGTTYYYTIKASNAAGLSLESSEVSGKGMSSFSISSVAVNGANAMTITFGSSTGASSYNVKYGTTSGSYSTTLTNQSSPVTISSLTSGTTYYFMVTAINSSGSVNANAEISAVPMNNFSLSSLVGSGTSATLNFGNSTGANSYNIKYGTTSGNYTITLTNQSSPKTITGLTAGTTYYFLVDAINASGTISAQAEQSLQIMGTPSSVVATGTTSSVSLSWGTVSGATSYNVYRSTLSGDYTLVTPFSTASNGYVDATVTNGVNYYYVITAVKGSSESSVSSEVNVRPVSAITGFSATGTTSAINLAFTGATGASSYTIYRSTSSGSYSTALASGVTGSSYSDSTAVTGTVYYYIIKSISTNSISQNSSEVSSVKIPTVQFQTTAQTVNENVGSVSLTINLSHVSDQNITVPITYSGTAASPTRYTGPSSLTINAGNSSGTISLSIIDDSAEELDQTIIATLGTPTNAALDTNSVNTTTLQDNDYPTLSVSDVTVTEGIGAYFTVSLNRSSIRNVTFDYYTQDISATAGTNYMSYSGSDSILAGATSKVFYVTTYPDYINTTSTAAKTFYFKLQNLTNLSASSNTTGTATIDKSDVLLPLTNTLVATRPTSGMSPTFSRSDTNDYVSTVADFEGILRSVKSGEARFQGARRVENLVVAPENLSTTWAAASLNGGSVTRTYYSTGGPFNNGHTVLVIDKNSYVLLSNANFTNKMLPSRVYQVSYYLKGTFSGQKIRLSQEGTLCNNGGSGCGYNLVTIDNTWKRYSTKITTGTVSGTFQPLLYQFTGDNAGDNSTLDVSGVQIEDVSGQTNQAPGDYVSCGVLSSPYHGAGVDCVKYFNTYNVNSFNASTSLVTEASGSSISLSKNYLKYSEQLNQSAGWTTNGVSVSTNVAVAPDGTTTADKIVESATTGHHSINTVSALTPGKTYTYSVFVKPIERYFVNLTFDSGGSPYMYRGAAFNLSTGQCQKTTPITNGTNTSIVSCSINPIGNGWFRISATDTIFSSATNAYTEIKIASSYSTNNDSQFTGDGTSGVYLWGAQVEEGSTASKYAATTGTQITQNLQGMLFEGSTSNTATQSTTLSNFSYLNSTTYSTTAPDGSSLAYQFTFDQASGPRTFWDNGGVANGTYTGSVYVKGIAGSTITSVQLYMKDFVTDTIRGSSGAITLSTSNWTRISVTGTTAGGSAGYRFEINGANSGTSAKVLLWGAQVENLPFVTSLIKTSGASKSRGVDSLTYPSANFVSTAETISANYSQLSSDALTGTRNYLFYIVDAGNNRLNVRTTDVSGTVPHFVTGNGSSVLTLTSTAGSQIYSAQNLLYARFNATNSSLTCNGSTQTGAIGYVDAASTTFYVGNALNNYQNILIKNIKASGRYFNSTELFDSGL